MKRYAEQDGPMFFLFEQADPNFEPWDLEPVLVVESPVVFDDDFDLTAAKKAREWYDKQYPDYPCR